MKPKWTSLLIILMLLMFVSMSSAATQTINTLPSAGSSFLSDVTGFNADEDANRFILYLTPQISEGGTASTSGTLSHTISAVTGFPNGYYTNQAATSHTYTASKDTFVYLRDDDTRVLVIGAATITYDSYLAFAEMANDTSQPTTPIGFLPLLEAVTDGTAITTVNDLRSLFMPVAAGYQPVEGDILRIDSSSEVTGAPTVENLSANTFYVTDKLQVGVGVSSVTFFAKGYVPTADDILVIDDTATAVTGTNTPIIKNAVQIGVGPSAVTLFASGVSPENKRYLILTDNAAGVTFSPGEPRRSILTNAGFGVWSNSDGVYPNRNSAVSGYFSASGTSITILTRGTFIVGDHIVVGQATDGISGIDETVAGVSIFEITTITLDSTSHYLTVGGDVFVRAADSSVSDVVLAMPGIVSVTKDGFDGWHKEHNTLDMWRAPISGVSKEGSIYSIYAKKGVNTTEQFWWPDGYDSKVEFYRQFAGRTMTVGAYVITWSANNVFLRIGAGTPGGGNTDSSYHTGGGDWEWIEVTGIVGVNNDQFIFGIQFDADSGDTAYVRGEPCLVFGTSIGEGNCANPLGEVVRFEADVVPAEYDDTSLSDEDQEINIEVRSDLKIPKGISELYITLKARDGVPADDIGVWLGPDTTYSAQDIGDVGLFLNTNVAADKHSTNNGWVRTDSGGDPWIFLNASGAGTLDIEIRIQGVRMR